MDLLQVLKLKTEGILNIDNCIFVSDFTDEEILPLKNKILTKYPELKVEEIIFNFKDIKDKESPRTSAIRYLLQVEQACDTIMTNLDTIYLVRDLKGFYNNQVIEILKKVNQNFLLWLISTQLGFNPIMSIFKNENDHREALINIHSTNSKIVSAFDEGLKAITETVEEALSGGLNNDTSTK